MLRCALLLTLLVLAVRVGAGAVKLTVAEPSGVARRGWPVTSGIPFAQGALADPKASALFDADGRELQLQTEALATWPDGSVRWLLLDFQIDLARGQRNTLTLRHGPGTTRRSVEEPLSVRRDDQRIIIDTGPMHVVLDPSCLAFLTGVWLDGVGAGGATFPDDAVCREHPEQIVLFDDQGRPFYGQCDHVGGRFDLTIEQNGPLRACIRLTGSHGLQAGRMFRYVARVHAFRGRSFLRLFYTFVNDHQDAVVAKLRALEIRLLLGSGAGTRAHNIHNGRPDRPWYGDPRRVFQVDERHYEVDGKAAGEHAPGWAALGGEKAGFAIGLRQFWQNWPKSLVIDTSSVALGICPRLPKGLYAGKPREEENKLYYHVRDGLHTFKVGVAKTHELWATFYKGKPDVGKLSAFFQAAEEPLLATCEPAYVDATKVYGDLPPADPAKYAGYDAWLSRALDSHLKLRDKTREYGMLNYGDWYGERKVNWGNLEYDLQHGLFLQYLRTGDRRFFLRAEQAARHHIDVDVVHATNPHLKNPWGPPPQVGEIWLHALNHTGGYYDEKTSGLPVSRVYHMGHSTNFGHVWVTGDLDYYYLTGDRRARTVALQMADAMLRHIPNRYGTHIRTLGWPTIICLAAYDLTHDKKYLDGARKNWEVLKKNIDWDKGWVIRLAKGHCLHPDRRCHGNVPFMEGMVLCALARYHRITRDPEVLRAITVGIDQMIRECWQDDVKTFRYTACPLSSKAPYCLFVLSAEAFAYEIAHTGNKEHLRILREGLRAAIPKGDAYHHGKALGQMTFFTPHALRMLEE